MQIGARYCLPHGGKYKENKVNSRNIFLTRDACRRLFVQFIGGAGARYRAAPAAGPTGTKIGVINVRQAIVATSEGKQASAELQSQFAARQSELENMNKQIADLRQRLSASGRAH